MFLRRIQVSIAVCIFLASRNLTNGSNLIPMTGLLDMKAVTTDDNHILVEKFILGDSNAEQKTYVQILQEKSSSTLSKRSIQQDDKGRTIIDLTPSKCTSESCYEGSFQAPKKKDCDSIIEAQMYNSTGSLRAFPGTVVYVWSGTCAAVFQNPLKNANYTLDYNWAELGLAVLNIQERCLRPKQLSIGGICQIKNYLNYTLEGVGISLQRISPS